MNKETKDNFGRALGKVSSYWTSCPQNKVLAQCWDLLNNPTDQKVTIGSLQQVHTKYVLRTFGYLKLPEQNPLNNFWKNTRSKLRLGLRCTILFERISSWRNYLQLVSNVLHLGLLNKIVNWPVSWMGFHSWPRQTQRLYLESKDRLYMGKLVPFPLTVNSPKIRFYFIFLINVLNFRYNV